MYDSHGPWLTGLVAIDSDLAAEQAELAHDPVESQTASGGGVQAQAVFGDQCSIIGKTRVGRRSRGPSDRRLILSVQAFHLLVSQSQLSLFTCSDLLDTRASMSRSTRRPAGSWSGLIGMAATLDQLDRRLLHVCGKFLRRSLGMPAPHSQTWCLTSHFGVARLITTVIGLRRSGWRRSADHDRRSCVSARSGARSATQNSDWADRSHRATRSRRIDH
jgi:hypothetical protein